MSFDLGTASEFARTLFPAQKNRPREFGGCPQISAKILVIQSRAFKHMFKIIGGDGQEYGPVSVGQIQQWLLEGRANTQTKVLREGTMDWRIIGEMPELMAPAAYLPTQTDGKAIASLVCGIISLWILPILASIPAIILGHMSRKAIRNSMGRLTGEGFVLAGLIMGYISLAIFGFLAIILILLAIYV
jgi:hypothetical protein